MLLNFARLLDQKFPKDVQNTIAIPKTARAKARGQKMKLLSSVKKCLEILSYVCDLLRIYEL